MTPVLYVIAAGARGGAEQVLREILRHLDRRRFEPIVVALHAGSFAEELAREGLAPVYHVPAGRFRQISRNLAAVRHLVRLVREHHIRLLHCNGTAAHLYGGLAAWLCSVPSIYHLHDVVDRSWSGQGWVDRMARLVPATRVVAVSRHVATSFALISKSQSLVHVIHNGIDPRECDGISAAGIRDRLGCGPGVPLVVWCGRLQRWKGAHVFVGAAAEVATRLPRARFLVVGGPLFGLEAPYEQELHRLAAGLPGGGAIQFVGRQDDARPYLVAADLVVHSAVRPEPFGLTLIEAMAAGKAVIASAEGGPGEIVQHDVTGLLVPGGDAAALAAAIETLLVDDRRRAAMGQAGSARVHDRFTIDRMMNRLHAVYAELTGEGHGALVETAGPASKEPSAHAIR